MTRAWAWRERWNTWVATGNARTFGFGDSGNDLGMLAAVETAVAMGNAMPEVKAVADYVTDDVAHDGTVTAMQHFGLI